MDYDANNWLEILPEDDHFVVWLFDHAIGDGATREEALDDAKKNIRRWVEEEH